MQEKKVTVYYVPKKKRHVRNYILFISILAVILYTVTAFILQFVVGVEASPTLTTCFYSFFGVEIITLASITKHKNKLEAAKDQAASQDATAERGGHYGRGI